MYTCRSKIRNRCRHRAASDAASTAKVGLPQVLVCKQVLCGTLQHQSPGGENVAAVRDRKRHVRILLDDEHRDAGLMHLLDDLEASLDEDRRQPHRRLVHEEQLRARHQRATHGDHLLLSSGECPRELRPSLVEQREECVDALEVFLPPPRIANEVRAHLEVLEHRHRSEEPAVLRDDRHSLLDPIARRAAGHLFAAELDGAVAGLHKSEDRLERSGLSRSVTAKERHELAFAHVQVQTLEDVDLSVVRVDVPQPEEVRDTVRAHFVSALRRPRYASTTRGSVATASNEPSAILTPWSRATTRSEMPSTTCMSCSITRIVYPPSSRSLPISSVISCVSRGFMPAAGSSSSRMRACVAMARAISSRLRFAYERL